MKYCSKVSFCQHAEDIFLSGGLTFPTPSISLVAIMNSCWFFVESALLKRLYCGVVRRYEFSKLDIRLNSYQKIGIKKEGHMTLFQLVCGRLPAYGRN